MEFTTKLRGQPRELLLFSTTALYALYTSSRNIFHKNQNSCIYFKRLINFQRLSNKKNECNSLLMLSYQFRN